MKNTLDKYIRKFSDMLRSPMYIGQLPIGLRNYAAARFVIPLAVFAVAAVSLFFTPLSWGFVLTVALMEILALGYSLYSCYELVRGDYYIVTGTVKAVESANMFAGALESLTQSGKNQKLILEQPDGSYATVFLGRKIKNEFSVGLPLIVYAENVYNENGIDTVRSYYTIVIAPNEKLDEPGEVARTAGREVSAGEPPQKGRAIDEESK